MAALGRDPGRLLHQIQPCILLIVADAQDGPAAHLLHSQPCPAVHALSCSASPTLRPYLPCSESRMQQSPPHFPAAPPQLVPPGTCSGQGVAAVVSSGRVEMGWQQMLHSTSSCHAWYAGHTCSATRKANKQGKQRSKHSKTRSSPAAEDWRMQTRLSAALLNSKQAGKQGKQHTAHQPLRTGGCKHTSLRHSKSKRASRETSRPAHSSPAAEELADAEHVTKQYKALEEDGQARRVWHLNRQAVQVAVPAVAPRPRRQQRGAVQGSSGAPQA